MVSFLCQLERILYRLGFSPHCFKGYPPKKKTAGDACLHSPVLRILSRHLSAGTIFQVTSPNFSLVCGTLTLSLICPPAGAPQGIWPTAKVKVKAGSGSRFCQRGRLEVRGGEQLKTGSLGLTVPLLPMPLSSRTWPPAPPSTGTASLGQVPSLMSLTVPICVVTGLLRGLNEIVPDEDSAQCLCIRNTGCIVAIPTITSCSFIVNYTAKLWDQHQVLC